MLNEKFILLGSPWDEDKAMMARWGLDGMQSFEQANVARKEGSRLTDVPPADVDTTTTRSTTTSGTASAQ